MENVFGNPRNERRYYAAQALPALITGQKFNLSPEAEGGKKELAKLAFAIADAMVDAADEKDPTVRTGSLV